MEQKRLFAVVLISVGILLAGCRTRKATFVTIGTGGVT
jgi:hypothetical protein